MTITQNRKGVDSKEIFPSIKDFINYLEINYNKLNFDNPKIKSSIESIYNDLLNKEGNVRLNRLNR